MWLDRFLHQTSVAILSLGLLLGMLACWQLGVWFRAVVARRWPDEDDGVGHILSAVLGLLALLVGFTFSLALERHELRRSLVVVEANALGTAYLRTGLIEAGPVLRTELRAYTAQRLAYGLNGGAKQAAAEQEAARLRAKIWRDATAAVLPHRDTDLAPMILDPLNEAFDAASSRSAALQSRIPTSVLASLAIYVWVSAAVLGYSVGRHSRHRIASGVMFVLLTMAIALILDLDRPRDGTIRIAQTAMQATLADMK